ncbi:MAG TPA: AraC family transcriptional regulator [Methyloceanibacter sp.]|jgi:AraC-like DNA-binding protein|nr:AraC family transcriptional regulator [Methyloceanibacter sp.]
MDALSDVLSAVRLDGAVYVNAEFTAPWCVATQYGLHSAAPKLPDSDHVVFFHLLTEGTCFARLAGGGEVIEVKAGDLLLLPHDDLHLLGSDLRLPLAEVKNAPPENGLLEFRAGGGGEATRFICGYIACDRRASRALLASLPPILRVPLGDVSLSGWLADLLRLGVEESRAQRPGSQSLLAKLSELAFTEALRRYVQSNPPELKGWLAGLRDAHVGRALALLHGDPTRAWTVDELAREVALSRSALAERFTALIGEPPMQYLTRWRLMLAAQALRSGGDAIARVAERSGYDSEASFTRAFKREFGMPPSTWRKTGGPGPANSSAGRSASG